MKQKIFTFLLIAAAGLTACRKTDNQPNITEYDDLQIQQYISSNGLTGFTKDATGISYKILTPGNGDSLKYSDKISIVYTLKSMDGKFISQDTITNHYYNFLGYLTTPNAITGFRLPVGLRTAVHDILKYKNGSMRLLIPSRLGYGVDGYGSGSITNVNTRIAGNQSLDVYVHVIGDQDVYDNKVINNYVAANNLSGYTKDFAVIDSAGIQVKKYYHYKTVTAGTGASISEFSTITTTYTGYLLNGTAFDVSSQTTATTLSPTSLIEGIKQALIGHAKAGTSISVLVPSSLGYGTALQNIIPSNSILKFEFQITTVQ